MYTSAGKEGGCRVSRLLYAALLVAALGVSEHVHVASAQPHLFASPPHTLVAAMGFADRTLDPGHEFEEVDGAADHAMYDTLVTFSKGVLTKVVPALATRWSASRGGKVYTFTLRSGVRFANGDPLSASDVVFSLLRVKNLQGNPSFLLESVATVTAPNSHTVRLVLNKPDPSIMSILPNPALGILDRKVVAAHGGTDAPNANTADSAESYLDSHSAGSGPYVLTSWLHGESIALAANHRYWGPRPKLNHVLLVNQQAPTEKLTLEKGDTDLGLDLSPNQYSSLRGNPRTRAYRLSGLTVFYLAFNLNRAINPALANNDVRQAVRYALDYKGLLSLGGPGSRRVAGLVPPQLLGALPQRSAPQQNLAKARALLKAGGYPNGFTATLLYTSDRQYNGEDLGLFAQKVQADLSAVGITLKLMPEPVAVGLPYYRAAKEELALEPWSPDYPDPGDYLSFLPGQPVGLRVSWPAGADPVLSRLLQQASTTSNSTKRAAVYRAIQTRLNSTGPYIPLFQPPQIVAAQRTVRGFHWNAIWDADFNVISK